MIGLLWAVADFCEKENKDDSETIELIKTIREDPIPFFETVGMAKWPRTELTDLGLRIGQRHKEKVETGYGYEVNETDVVEEKTQE